MSNFKSPTLTAEQCNRDQACGGDKKVAAGGSVGYNFSRENGEKLLSCSIRFSC